MTIPPDTGHTSVMLAFFLKSDDAIALMQAAAPLAPLEDAAALHLTLCFLGDASALADQKAAIEQAAERFAQQAAPVEGVISGIGRFMTAEDNDTNAVYASFDAPTLPAWRQGLLSALHAVGVTLELQHGYTPHITLAYIPKDAPLPHVTLPPLPLVFDTLALCWGNDRIEYPCANATVKDVSAIPSAVLVSGPGGLLSSPGLQGLTLGKKKRPIRQLAKYLGMTVKAQWDTAYINSLPDSAFLFIARGGTKDATGRTVPRSLRSLPYRSATGDVDLDHLRNAIARISQSTAPGLTLGRKRALQNHAQHMLARLTKSAHKAPFNQSGSSAGGNKVTLIGNLCRAGGKFVACGPAQQAKIADRSAVRDARTETNRAAVHTALGGAVDTSALLSFAKGNAVDSATADSFVQHGLAERDKQGTLRFTTQGKALASAVQSGHARTAQDALSKGHDAVAKDQAQAASHAQKLSAAAQRKQDIAKQRSDRQTAAEQKRQERTQATTAKRTAADTKRAAAAAKRQNVSAAHIATRTILTEAGINKRQNAAAAKRQAGQAKQQAHATAVQARGQRALTAGVKRSAAEQKRAADQAARQAARVAAQVQRSNERVARQQAAEAKRQAAAAAKHKSLAVFKDVKGQWRWLAISSTAYRDRDGEIVSRKALADDCARADADGQYGPLRWWHLPGVDIGMCDFNALSGTCLVESGTFVSPAIAERVAAKAGDLQVSIGFMHPLTEPDAERTFQRIHRFERSLAPRGYVSNPFTSLHVKELPVDAIKVKALEALLGPDVTAQLLAKVQETTKAAEAGGATYKAAVPESVTIGGQTYVLAAKAPPVPAAAADTEDAPEGSPADIAEDQQEAAALDPDTLVADMTADELEALLTSVITTCMGGDAMKAAVGAAMPKPVVDTASQKALTAQAVEIASLKATISEAATAITGLQAGVKAATDKLAEIEGEQPRAIKSQRPSQESSNVIQMPAQKSDTADIGNFIQRLVLDRPAVNE